MNFRNIIFSVIVLLLIACLYDARSVFAQDSCSLTESDVQGPYYIPDVPFRARLAGPGEPGEPITIKGRVLSSDCSTPIKNVLIEIWQTDAQGKYHGREDNFRLRGQIKSDDKGYYEFISVMPGSYRLLNGFRPAHIHIKISHPDYRNVVTQLYFKGDPYLWPNDACGRGCRSNDPNRIIELKKKKQEKRDILEGIWPIVLYPAKKKF